MVKFGVKPIGKTVVLGSSKPFMDVYNGVHNNGRYQVVMPHSSQLRGILGVPREFLDKTFMSQLQLDPLSHSYKNLLEAGNRTIKDFALENKNFALITDASGFPYDENAFMVFNRKLISNLKPAGLRTVIRIASGGAVGFDMMDPAKDDISRSAYNAFTVTPIILDGQDIGLLEKPSEDGPLLL
jgi:hypothetical protein